jgi:hypothetical protein
MFRAGFFIELHRLPLVNVGDPVQRLVGGAAANTKQ